MPKIETLVDDIYGVFEKDIEIPEGEVLAFGERLGKLLAGRLGKQNREHLRLSNLGSPCARQLWYRINTPELGEKLSGPARIKFLIGDITEAVVLFLARLAGHTVEDEQFEVDVDGVKGHIDALVDTELVDVKSASPYSFDKFKNGLKAEEDSFGYLTQLGSYGKAKGKRRGHFLAVNKVLGTLCLDTHDPLPEVDVEEKIKATKEILESASPPPRGFDDVPDGKSGNRKLGINCSYCAFKDTCWPGLKQYNYARGPVFLTEVRREPRVESQSS